MELPEKIVKIKKMVNDWNKVRWDHEGALQFLNSGAYFSIKREFVSLWSGDSPQMIHAYLGVDDNKLFFILIDDVTDKIPLNEMKDVDLAKIFIQEFNNDMGLLDYDFIKMEKSSKGVTKEEALARVLRWQMMKETWIVDQILSPDDDQVGIARVFNIPFSDLEEIVKKKALKDIVAVMGLKFRQSGVTKKVEGESIYLLDLSFWAIENKPEEIEKQDPTVGIEDLTALCPPYPTPPYTDSYSIQFGW